MRLTALARVLRLGVPAKCALCFGVLLALSCASQVISIATKSTRILLVVTTIAGLFALLVYLVWGVRSRRRRVIPLLFVVILLAGGVGIHFVRGQRIADAHALRRAYVRRIHSFGNTLYIWGGESHVGIDCSGLVRIALLEAMAERSFVEGNARLLESAWRFWWRDMTARCMLNRKYGYTRPIGHAKRLSLPGSTQMMAGEVLKEGDLAVTDNGVHVLVYTGKGCWTEGNPDDGRVVTNKAAGSSRAYFNMPVTLLRWSVLDD